MSSQAIADEEHQLKKRLRRINEAFMVVHKVCSLAWVEGRCYPALSAHARADARPVVSASSPSPRRGRRYTYTTRTMCPSRHLRSG